VSSSGLASPARLSCRERRPRWDPAPSNANLRLAAHRFLLEWDARWIEGTGDHVTTATESTSSPHADPLGFGSAPNRAADPGGGCTRPGGLRRWWPPTLCCALYVALAMIYFGHFGSMGSNFMTGPRGIDQISQIWWIAWVQSSLAHGHDPFFTTWQNYPVGQNAGWNCSMLALGVLISPITTAFGPVVAWNVLLKLAIILSATSMCLVLRRWTTWWPAAFFGGLLYGFCAYETALGSTYLFLTFVPLPPLFLLLLHEALVRQRWGAARVGALLGLVAGLQFLVSAEVFASTVLIGGIAAALYLLFNWRSTAAGRAYIKRAALWGVLVGGLLLVIPIGYTLIGPEHINGAVNSPTYLEMLHADLLGPIVPTGDQRLTTSALSQASAEHLGYTALMCFGLPLVLLSLAFMWWLRRRGVVQFVGAMAAISFLLSLGPHLYVWGHNTGVLLPMAILNQLSLTAGFIAARFSLFTALFVAALIAIGLEELFRRLLGSSALQEMTPRRRVITATVVVLVIGLAAAIPTMPAHAQQVSRTDASPFFASDSSTPSAIRAAMCMLSIRMYVYDRSSVQLLSVRLVKAFLEQTGCGELGLTSADGKYTVIEVECLGACGFATPIMVNDDFIDSVSVARVPEILKKYS